jgi:hypothetical protein|nr:MAG TPA_asm: hypothetical protein [Caudoviricetes sp.]
MIPIRKPHIRFCHFQKSFECIMWHYKPGEQALVTGYGKTPKDAYEEYRLVKQKFETHEDW